MSGGTIAVKPTARQLDLLRAIARFRKARGYSPTVREMAKEMKLAAQSGVLTHLRMLQIKGLVRRDEGVQRSTLITEAGERVLSEVSA